MSVIYVLTPGAEIKKSGGRLVVEVEDKILRSIPLLDVETIVVGRNAQLSTQLIFELLKQNSHIVYVNRKGDIVGSMGESLVNSAKLLYQVDVFRDETARLELSKFIVESKIQAQKDVIGRYAKRLGNSSLGAAKKEIKKSLILLKRAGSIEAVRGVEGIASKHYFSLWGQILSGDWQWKGRIRHPAVDPVNALLSYSYSFLEREVRLTLLTIGLDERIGVLHSNNGRKDSLVFDLMDLFRQKICDRLVLALLNKQVLRAEHFDTTENSCYLTQDGRLKWLSHYEKYMETPMQEYNGRTPRRWIELEIKSFYKWVLSYGKFTEEKLLG